MSVRQAAEETPFVKEIILPNCHFAGPNRRIVRMDLTGAEVSDDPGHEDRELTDTEFVEAWKKARESGSSED